MKRGDIVKFRLGISEQMLQGRVNWVKEGNVGVTLVGAEFGGQEATVMPESECEVVVDFKGNDLKVDISKLSTDDLIASIERLKNMRFPKKVTRVSHMSGNRKTDSKRAQMARLAEALENDPKLLDDLIQKALKEEE